MSDHVVARMMADLSVPLEGCGRISAWGVGLAGEICVAAPSPNTGIRVVRGERTIEIPRAAPSSFIQPFGDEHVLLAGARAGIQANAIVIDARGERVRSFRLGDGIADVRVDSHRNIWVSYFDEGVFGEDPLARAGLRLFDENGISLWEFDSRVAQIDDVYAINLEPDGTLWAYYYSAFGIVRVRDREITHWEFGHGGGRALAVGPRGVTLLGKDGARSIELRGTKAQEVARFPVLDPDGNSLDTPAIGVGPALWFQRDRQIWRADVSQKPE